jgi:biotin carboxyl carrier protein
MWLDVPHLRYQRQLPTWGTHPLRQAHPLYRPHLLLQLLRLLWLSDPNLKTINSPMVGTFYATPSPENPPFVAVGSPVKPDTVVCIIEAMKVMNEIPSEISGTVVECLVANGTSVEFGQPLFRVKVG